MVALPPQARQRELEAAQAALQARLREIDTRRLQHKEAFIRSSVADATSTQGGIPEYLRLLLADQKKDEDAYDQYVRDATLHNQSAIRFRLLMESPFASMPTLNDRFALAELLGVSSSGVEVWKATDMYAGNAPVTLKISSDHHMIAYDYKAIAKIDVNDAVVGLSRDGVLITTFHDKQYSMYALHFMEDDLQSILLVPLLRADPLLQRRPDGRLAFVLAEAVAFQVARCIQHLCIEARVAHCDIRPSNVLVTQPWNVALTNFKSARSRRELLPTIPHHKVKDMDAASVMYSAPECFNCLEALGNTVTCDTADVWALGVLYFFMIYGCHPLVPGLIVLDDAMKLSFVDHLRNYSGTITFPSTPAVPAYAQRVIQACLHKDPTKRLQSESLVTSGFFHPGGGE